MTDVERARKVVAYYRALGLCPLPSLPDDKRPALREFASHYGATPVPESVYSEWSMTNVQLITGTKSPTPTKLLVVDCDGEEAQEVWGRMLTLNNDTSDGAWVSVSGSGAGRHIYYRIPASVTDCKSGMGWGLWDTFGGKDNKGAWSPHREVRIVADRALVVAPPSIHVNTGKPYEFIPTHSPKTVRLPRFAPVWLLDMPRLGSPRFGRETEQDRNIIRVKACRRHFRCRYSSQEVLDAIPDKLAVARGWGLVIASVVNGSGWVKCYVPGREELGTSASPSGSFSVETGRCVDMTIGRWMTLFDVGVAFGHFLNWLDCRSALGDHFCPRGI